MEPNSSFGYWVRRRRKALDMTQEMLAQRVGCALDTIRKIESGARRPSRQIAERLAEQLELPRESWDDFLLAARAPLAAENLRLPGDTLAPPSAKSHHVEQGVMAEGLPGSTTTFLCTDIEGSTQLWERYPDAMRRALARHDVLLHEVVAAHGGTVFKTSGDGVYAAFSHASAALAAAIASQRALQAEPWALREALRVRVALHTGVAEARDNDYFGPTLNRAARLLDVGYGGQILLSRTTQDFICDTLVPDVELRNLGTHQLKDLTRSEQIFQVIAPGLPTDFPPLRTHDAQRHNLPAQLTSLVGRAAEIAAVCTQLRRGEVRLLTVTGPGGAGKTRLAIQAAAGLLSDFAYGISFVALAPIADPAFVVSTIAQSLGVKESGEQPLVKDLKRYLRGKELLLLLDNFEHMQEAAPLVGELLAAVPGLKVLVTSRAVLHLPGEHELTVPPLSLPDLSQETAVEQIAQSHAVQLFLERARAVKADFELTPANASAVAELCVRLDGLPLALELAAARSKLFKPEALLTRLNQRFALLVGGPQNLPAHQQTLRGTLDWSYNLLTVEEQVLFQRLAVFLAGCSFEAAAAVCAGDDDFTLDVLDGIQSLVDKSLLRPIDSFDDEPRIMMLESIREYALERLVASADEQKFRARHARYFLAIAEEAEPLLMTGEWREWQGRLTQELDNLRAAFGWSLTLTAEQGTALRLASAMWCFWWFIGRQSQGIIWFERALHATETEAYSEQLAYERATALYRMAFLVQVQHDDLMRVISLGQESLKLFKRLNDPSGMGWALCIIGSAEHWKGNPDQARISLEQSQTLFQQVGDVRGQIWTLNELSSVAHLHHEVARSRELSEASLALAKATGDLFNIAHCLTSLGCLAQDEGDLDQAARYFHESWMLDQELGHTETMANTLHNLGFIAWLQGNTELAREQFAQSLALSEKLESRRFIGMGLTDMAVIIGAAGENERAAQLFGAAAKLFGDMWLEPSERAFYQEGEARVQAQLGEQQFAAAYTAGQALSLKQAIREALRRS